MDQIPNHHVTLARLEYCYNARLDNQPAQANYLGNVFDEGGSHKTHQQSQSQPKPDVVDPIQHALKPVADKTGAVMAPIDQAFKIFQQRYPTIPIFMSDNKHPSPVGTYLAACVYFKIFTGESPLGLSRRYERKDENGKKIFLGMVEKSSAKICQEIVDEIFPD